MAVGAQAMKKCSSCKTDKETKEFYKDKNRKDGYYPQCKICRKEEYNKNIEYNKKYHQEHYIKNHEAKKKKRNKHYAENKASIRETKKRISSKYTAAKASAKSRELSFTISFEEYSEIIATGNCRYCSGSLPEFGYSLDRVDSALGYEKNNVVACCSDCNQMKNDKTVKEFLTHIRKIVENYKHTP